MLTLYEILDVSSKASTPEIKRSFHKQALIYHPDKNKRPDAARKFRAIHYAYQVLSDEDKRAQYDQKLLNMDLQECSQESKPEDSTWNKTDKGFLMKYVQKYLRKPLESFQSRAGLITINAKRFLLAEFSRARDKTLYWVMVPVNHYYKCRSRVHLAMERTNLEILALRRQCEFLLSKTVHNIHIKKIAIGNGLVSLRKKILGWIMAPVYFFQRIRSRVLLAKEKIIFKILSLKSHLENLNNH